MLGNMKDQRQNLKASDVVLVSDISCVLCWINVICSATPSVCYASNTERLGAVFTKSISFSFFFEVDLLI